MSFKAYVVHGSIIYAQLESLLRPPFFLFHKYSLAHTRQLARAKFVAACNYSHPGFTDLLTY
jgi:hypothetical protein